MYEIGCSIFKANVVNGVPQYLFSNFICLSIGCFVVNISASIFSLQADASAGTKSSFSSLLSEAISASLKSLSLVIVASLLDKSLRKEVYSGMIDKLCSLAFAISGYGAQIASITSFQAG